MTTKAEAARVRRWELEEAYREAIGDLADRAGAFEGQAEGVMGYLVTRQEVVAALIVRRAYVGADDAGELRTRIAAIDDTTLTECMTLLEEALEERTRAGAVAKAKSPVAKEILSVARIAGHGLKYEFYPLASLSAYVEGLHPWDRPPADKGWSTRLAIAINDRLGRDADDFRAIRPDDLSVGSGRSLRVMMHDALHSPRGWTTYCADPRNAPDAAIDTIATDVSEYIANIDANEQKIIEMLSKAKMGLHLEVHDTPGFTITRFWLESARFGKPTDEQRGAVDTIDVAMSILSLNKALEVGVQEKSATAWSDGGMSMTDVRYAMTVQRRRQAIRDQRRTDTRIEVDPVLAAMLSGLDQYEREELLDAMRDAPGATFLRNDLVDDGHDIPEGIETLRIHEGDVVGRVRLARKVSWNGGVMMCHGFSLPDTIVSALPGRKLSAVIEHPLGGHLTIASARNVKDGTVRVTVSEPKVAWERIGKASGKTGTRR